MYRFLLLASFSITVFGLTSCGNSANQGTKKDPGSYFSEAVKNVRWIDLEKKLADTLKITLNGTEKAFTFSYSKENKATTIAEVGTSNSLTGQVTKYKDIYFINEAVDSVFSLYAFAIKKKKSVIGLADIFNQPKRVYDIVSAGHDDGLVKEQKGKDYFLKGDKKKILSMYSSMLLESDTWELKE